MSSVGGSKSVEVFRAEGVGKKFPGVRALDDVNLTLNSGQIHGLVGHNGAGKSTLVKILAGVLEPSEGTLIVNGQERKLRSAVDGLRQGIGVLFQEPSLCPNLTVAENIWLEETALAWNFSGLDKRKLHREAENALSRIGASIPLSVKVVTLSIADQQLVALARILRLKPVALVLDEPTAPLSGPEIERVMELAERLRSEGVAILYISHRLAEVTRLCDEITILREGKRVATVSAKQASIRSLIELMVGREISVSERLPLPAPQSGEEPVLEAIDWQRLGDRIVPNLQVRPGEVLGILGLPGSGRERMIQSLFGLSKWADIKTLRINGQNVARRSTAMHRLGVGMMPADRHAEGLFALMSVQDNMAIGSRSRSWSLRDFVSERSVSNEFVEQLKIKLTSLNTAIRFLSGGNQQKVMLARMLGAEMSVVVMDEPSQGIDVTSREQLYETIHELAKRRTAFIVGSSDVEELAIFSTRIWVIHGNRFVSEFREPYDIAQLVAAATGVYEQEPQRI